MEGHRSYSEDGERSWYPYPAEARRDPAEARHGEFGQEDSRYEGDRYRVPEPRYAEDQETRPAGLGPRSAQPDPLLPGPAGYPGDRAGATGYPAERDTGAVGFPAEREDPGGYPERERYPAAGAGAPGFVRDAADTSRYQPESRDAQGTVEPGDPSVRYQPEKTRPAAPAVPQPGPSGAGGPTPGPYPPSGPQPGAFASDPGPADGADAATRFHTEPIDRAALRRSPGMGAPAAPVPPAPEGAVYRTRRAGIAALLVIIAIIAEILFVRILLAGEFGDSFQAHEVLTGIFGMTGAPLTTMGLYGLMTGAAAGPTPGRSWLRTPLAYLPVGLLLLIASALAAG